MGTSRDWVELLEVVRNDSEGNVFVVEEAVGLFEAEEAVAEGVESGAEFGGEGGLGHGFLAWGLHGRWIVGNILFFVHEKSPEQKLAGREVGLMLGAGAKYFESTI